MYKTKRYKTKRYKTKRYKTKRYKTKRYKKATGLSNNIQCNNNDMNIYYKCLDEDTFIRDIKEDFKKLHKKLINKKYINTKYFNTTFKHLLNQLERDFKKKCNDNEIMKKCFEYLLKNNLYLLKNNSVSWEPTQEITERTKINKEKNDATLGRIIASQILKE